MNDRHDLMFYARNIFPKSLRINNYQQKKTLLADALFTTMSYFLYEGKTDLAVLSKEVLTILTQKNLFLESQVTSWISNHFVPSARTLLTREYQKSNLQGKVWPIKDYLDHRQSGASMHNEAALFLLLLNPKLDLNDPAWTCLSQYLVLYTDIYSWKKDKKARDYYNILFSIQYELEISEVESEKFLNALIISRETLLRNKAKRHSEEVRVFLESFKKGASLWCETTPRYRV